MNKYLKYGLIAVASLVSLFVSLLLVIALTVKPNDYKPQIVRLVKEKTQRTLVLGGDIRLALFPKLGLDLGKVSLSERNSPKVFASVHGLSLYVAWLPLLERRLVVDRISVDGARVHLLRRRDGGSNFGDLAGPPTGKKAQTEPGGQLKFDVAGIRVSNSSLSYDDRQSGRKIDISGLNLKTGRLKEGSRADVSGAFDLQVNRPGVKLHTRLNGGLTFDLARPRYQLQNADVEVKGLAAGISGLALSLRGDVDAAPRDGAFSARGLKLTVSGQRGTDHFQLDLSAPKVQLSKAKASSGKLLLEARIEQPQGAMHAVLSAPGLEGSSRAFKARGLTLELDGKQGANTLKGKLTTRLAGSLEAQRLDFDPLRGDIEIRGADLPKGGVRADLKGDAHVELKSRKVALKLAGSVDDSNVTARLGMSGFAFPFYRFDVAIDRLDVDRYLPPKAKRKAAAPAGAQGRQAEKALDLTALKGLNAQGSLRIGSLKFDNVKSSDVRLELKAAKGKVALAPLSAKLYQGALAGSLSVDAAAVPRLATRQRLSGVSIGPLVKDLTGKDVVAGKGNVSVDVSTRGATVGAMKKALNGSAALDLRDGMIKGIDIAAVLRRAKARLGVLKGEQTVAANAEEKTDFSELKARFRIRNGVAHNDDLSAKSPLLRVSGKGDIDIGADAMDYLAKATVVASLKGQGGAELAALRGVTVPVRVSGPFDALRYRLDFNAMASGMAKQKVERKKEEVKGKVQKKLQQQLKGLFGK